MERLKQFLRSPLIPAQTLRGLLTGVVALLSVAFVISFVCGVQSELFDTESYLFCFGICGVLLFSLRRASDLEMPLLAAMVWSLAIFALPRLLSYALIPYALYFPFSNFSLDVVNRGVGFTFLGVVAAVLGIFGSGWLYRRFFPKDQSPLERSWMQAPRLGPLLLGFLVIFIADFYFNIFLGITAVNRQHFGVWHPFVMGMKTIIGVDTAFFIVFGILIMRARKGGSYAWTLLCITTIAYVMTLTIAGSKSGTLRVSAMLFAFAVVAFERQKFQWRYIALVIFMLGALGPVTFMLGAYARLSFSQTEAAKKIMAEGSVEGVYNQLHQVEFKAAEAERAKMLREMRAKKARRDASVAKSKPRVKREETKSTVVAQADGSTASSVVDETVANNEVVDELEDSIDTTVEAVGEPPKWILFALPMLNRLGEIDYGMHLVSNADRAAQGETYLSAWYIAESFFNMIMPGDPFPEAKLPTSRVQPLLFRGASVEAVEIGFNTEPMTLWGASALHFGRGLGIVFILFAVGAINFMVLWLSRQARFLRLEHAALAYWIPSFLIFQFFGFDHFLSLMVFIFVQVIAFEVVVHLISKVWKQRVQTVPGAEVA